ncbi:hypothetical protein [Corynebacterium coyleae]|uniref:Uncharacterized protein n=1 Tax=Corynebacterium coyleae TaxID=53374 RepID=A0ABX8KVQ5_9CORY|nr:hypothetical protein [Corynebacterium coyleae]QXB17878.1 hypothetical protein I6L55_08220 [Corynebacterium coyleae]
MRVQTIDRAATVRLVVGEVHGTSTPPALVAVAYTHGDRQFWIATITSAVTVDLNRRLASHVDELNVILQPVQPPFLLFVLVVLYQRRRTQHVHQFLLAARREYADETWFDDVVGEVCC